MEVIKRNGRREGVQMDKVTLRLRKLCDMQPRLTADPVLVAVKVIQSIHDGITTTKLDELSAEVSVAMSTAHPDYETLAARVCVSNLHKATKSSMVEVCQQLHNNVNANGEKHSIISDELWDLVLRNNKAITGMLDFSRDYGYTYFGLKTLERGYLARVGSKIVERPQHMLMRVALGIWGEDLDRAAETYRLLSERWFTHATPTLFNAGTRFPQLSSWYGVLLTSTTAGTDVY